MTDTRIKSIEFIEDKHEYWFTDKQGQHRRLYGITSVIGKMLGKDFPVTDTVLLATMYGSQVHKEVEKHFNEGQGLSTEGAKWVVSDLAELSRYFPVNKIQSEVMVSDFEGTASKVDVVLFMKDGGAFLFDIKTTSRFDREYCSLQLSVYQYLFEKCYGIKVKGLYVLSTKMKRRFHIFYQGDEKVRQILERNITERQ